MRRLILIVVTLLIMAVFWLMVTDSVKAAGYSYYPSYSYSYPTYSYYTPIYKEVPVYKEYPIYKEVTIPKYAVVPLYSVYYTPQQQPASAPCNGHSANVATPQASVTNGSHAPVNGSCAVAEQKVAKLEAQLELLLRIMGNGNTPPPGAVHTPPKGKVPVPPKEKLPTPKPDVPPDKEPTSADVQKDTVQRGINAMYLGCVKCHESKVSATEGGGFTMFNDKTVVNLTQRQWAKIENELKDDKMPPKKDSKGNPVPPLQKPQRDEILAMVAIARSETAPK